MDAELSALAEATSEIAVIAKDFGLDYFPMRFEICPADVLYSFGAYGMPTRFTHWSFGKTYYKMKIMYDFNLSRIYELVINANPGYAFLLESNTLIQNKLVIAHVFAHADFFKNNAWFAGTNRDMVEAMAIHAGRIREYEFLYGRLEVEKTLDAALAIQEHIDPDRLIKAPQDEKPVQKQLTPYDDIWSMGEKKQAEPPEEIKKFPPRPEKDILSFIGKNSHILKEWQRDILDMVRQEMLYFWPQIQTKIINEGWAAFWHARIMREMDLGDDETIEFARLHAGIIQPSRTSLNPYFLGMRIFEDLEKRLGDREQLFQIREQENDISFIRNYLTKELVEELDLYLFKKQGQQWKVTDTEWETVRQGILNGLTNGGFPYLVVADGDHHGSGQLLLRHRHEGTDLDVYYMEKTLPYVYQLWGKPVSLETVLEGRPMIFSYDGTKTSRAGA